MRIFDCFSGIGGFRSAAKMCLADNARFVGSCEFDKYARKTYEVMHEPNKGDELEISDIKDVTRIGNGRLRTVKQIAGRLNSKCKNIDLFTAGFPCQPHSLMGNRLGVQDERGAVTNDMFALIKAIAPENVVLENVRAIRSVNNGLLFNEILAELEKDYNVSWFELNASDFGVPQVRRRLFIVGSKNKIPNFTFKQIPLRGTHFPTTWHLLERDVEKKYYLSEKIKTTILADEHKGYRRKAEINRLIARPLTRTMHKMHRASQDNYFSDSYIKGDFNNENWSVIESRSGRKKIRRITPKEAFRIQTFSETEIERAQCAGISDTQLYMQAGNAVPVNLAKSVLENLI